MIASGALDLPGVLQLSDADEVVAGTKLTKVMVALPGWGKVSSKRLLAELGIDGDRFVGQLNAVDREKLVAALS